MDTCEGGELVELTRSECLKLLAGGIIGRVVFTDHALPTVQPVNYLLDGEEIIFRTANGSKLAAATRNAVVAFQLDEFDTTTRSGWSVLGVGEAYEVVDPPRLAELADLQPDPWVREHDAHTLSIPLAILTGRLITTDRSEDVASTRGSTESDDTRVDRPQRVGTLLAADSPPPPHR